MLTYLSQKNCILVTIYIELMHHRNKWFSLVWQGQEALNHNTNAAVGVPDVQNPACQEDRGVDKGMSRTCLFSTNKVMQIEQIQLRVIAE